MPKVRMKPSRPIRRRPKPKAKPSKKPVNHKDD
jgi:hypothetical protein